MNNKIVFTKAEKASILHVLGLRLSHYDVMLCNNALTSQQKIELECSRDYWSSIISKLDSFLSYETSNL